MKYASVSAVYVLFSTAALSAVVEPTYYNYVYYAPSSSIAIWSDASVHMYEESNTYYAMGDFGIWFTGPGKDLNGSTYVLGGPSSPVFDGLLPDGTNEVQGSWMFPYNGVPANGSWVTFGKKNEIVDWSIGGWYENSYGEDMFFSQIGTPTTVSPEDLYYLPNPNILDGILVYDHEIWEGYYDDQYPTRVFSTQRGIWKKFAGAWEDTIIVNPAPVPPLNGCGPSGGVPSKCDQIAVAPVPPSLMLLASGLAGIGLLRRRRSRLAG
jgi:MYXO-CTERM domain-containing protein